VERPEDYRWNAAGYHIQSNNKDDFLSLDFGLREFGVLGAKERLRRYRRFLYETGAAIDKGKGVVLAPATHSHRPFAQTTGLTQERKETAKNRVASRDSEMQLSSWRWRFLAALSCSGRENLLLRY
jgi:hypothetical protein